MCAVRGYFSYGEENVEEKAEKAIEKYGEMVYNRFVTPWGCKGFDGDFEV